MRALALPARHGEILAAARLNCCDRPAHLRKSLLRRYVDFAYAFARWGEISTLYFAQGVDLPNRSIRRDFLSYTAFRKLRDARNRIPASPTTNYACLMQDKLLFERYFEPCGAPIARSLAEVGIEREDTRRMLEALLGEVGDVFVKPRFGIKGRGAFRLGRAGDQPAVNGTPATWDEVLDRVKTPSLVQRLIEQHAAVAQLHPASLNTLRVITYRRGEDIDVFLAYLRMAAAGEVIDNSALARAIVRVDEHTGRLAERGYAIRGPIASVASRHPDTGVAFADVVIPDIAGCLNAAKQLHAWLPGLYSVGWDVAVTPRGPLVIEGNEDWGATTAMWAMPDFNPRFLAMLSPNHEATR